MPSGAAHGRSHVRPQQPSQPIDVDDLFDFEIVRTNPPKEPIEGVEVISPARARVLGINKGFRNYGSTGAWMKSKQREARRLEKQKANAINLLGDDDDDNAPGPSVRRTSRATPSGNTVRGRNSRTPADAMDVDRPSIGGHRALNVIEISDSEGGPEPGPEFRQSPMFVSPAPDQDSVGSDSEESWIDFDYEEDVLDPMDIVDEDDVPTPSVDKGKGRAVDSDFSDRTMRPLPQRWTQHEMPRFDMQNRPFVKKKGAKVRIWDADVIPDLYHPTVLNHLMPFKRHQNSMYSLACHRTTLSRGGIPRTNDVICTQLSVSRLRIAAHYQKTSGVVNKIAQSNGIVAVASAASGGGSDGPNPSSLPEIDEYNRNGNLVFWQGEKFVPPESHTLGGESIPGRTHFRRWRGTSTEHGTSRDEDGMIPKYYTINDVAFDPQNGHNMLTSGNDCYVRVWEVHKSVGEKPLHTQDMLQLKFMDVVNDIQFHPGCGTSDPLVAVSCYDGRIHLIEGYRSNQRDVIEVKSGHGKEYQKAGMFLWAAQRPEVGTRNSDSRIFASSEAPEDSGAKCQHGCYDANTRGCLYKFSNEDSGDTMALNSQGETLALVTSGTHKTLGLYDVAKGERTTTKTANIPSKDSRPNALWEVNAARFSPDNVLLALGLSDDRVLIYDTRFISTNRGPCMTYDLERGLRDGEEHYGVTALEWVPGYYGNRGLGLLTGGSDGCVRLWDVGQGHNPEDIGWIEDIWSPENVIALCDHGIASASLGRNREEYRLVVGDVGGEVYVFV
ncbi:WD40 repeat-like protein [Schizopora paradoxa]|uniref:WD40 repeat-like protein n=1 Tax=Schizopora paradoxa TaxID=27342 RepID=A0A0H2RUM4_9AGAM|nr:WD40 repeat-like protein [Schizopora paradoxa]